LQAKWSDATIESIQSGIKRQVKFRRLFNFESLALLHLHQYNVVGVLGLAQHNPANALCWASQAQHQPSKVLLFLHYHRFNPLTKNVKKGGDG